MKKQYNRRDFLKRSLASAASATPLMAMLGSLQTLEAAETSGDYKAIVCVLLEGGADVFNMIAPTQNDSYGDYKAIRKDMALSQESLLSFSHSNSSGLNSLAYGMRNNMGKMQQLFGKKKLSIIANVGTLVQPVTLADIKNGTPLPPQLFAHNTQRDLWMRGDAKNPQQKGWAARAGDIFYPTPNPYFNITVGGNNTMQLGGIAEAIAFDDAYISPDTMKYYGFGPDSGSGELGSVYQRIYEGKQNDNNKLLAAFAKRRVEKLNQQVNLEGLFDNVKNFDNFSTGVHETGVSLGKQLELVAQILSIRNNFPGPKKRQIFFVNHHGWDTHDSDNEHQVGYLSDSLFAFQSSLETMGIENSVTTFTISDFGRSLSPNGAGTDHGWGSHAFVMGGAVKGGDIYGKMPQLSNDSPDGLGDSMIPTTSMEEYLATIVKWFGATENELNTIFPNLSSFARNNMGFMED